MELDDDLKKNVKEIPQGLVHVDDEDAVDDETVSPETEEKMVREAEMGGMGEP